MRRNFEKIKVTSQRIYIHYVNKIRQTDPTELKTFIVAIMTYQEILYTVKFKIMYTPQPRSDDAIPRSPTYGQVYNFFIYQNLVQT